MPEDLIRAVEIMTEVEHTFSRRLLEIEDETAHTDEVMAQRVALWALLGGGDLAPDIDATCAQRADALLRRIEHVRENRARRIGA